MEWLLVEVDDEVGVLEEVEVFHKRSGFFIILKLAGVIIALIGRLFQILFKPHKRFPDRLLKYRRRLLLIPRFNTDLKCKFRQCQVLIIRQRVYLL